MFGVDLTLVVGETLAIIGANGVGKSTLMRSISGLLKSAPGMIRFDGDNVGALPAPDIMAMGIAMVPEGRKLFPSLSVEENLLIGAYGRTIQGLWNLAKIYDLFPVLKERRHSPGTALSGGQPAADGGHWTRPDVHPPRPFVRRDQPWPRACRDQGHFRSKFLVGADGGNSLVATHQDLPFEGKMGVGGSMNILFRADLSKYVAHRPSVLYWVMQPGADAGGIGVGLVRMVRPWNEWLIAWGYDITQPAAEVDAALATQVARQLVGDPALEIELISANTWTVNIMYATNMQKGRVFILGDAAHRHPPSNGLGSNTSIQDAFNLAWKLAAVVKGRATPKLLESYTVERAPVAMQIVNRANQSTGEFGPIFAALGMDAGVKPEIMQKNLMARCDASPGVERQRAAIRDAIAFKKYEFDAHGVEMNQRYTSAAQ